MSLIEEDRTGEPRPIPQENKSEPETRLQREPTDFWQGMSPRTAFSFGLMCAVAASSALGLVFALSVILRGSQG